MLILQVYLIILQPKSITSEDMEMIMKFFSFSMIKMMAQALGIKLKTIGPKEKFNFFKKTFIFYFFFFKMKI